jgi:hypothetical protein
LATLSHVFGQSIGGVDDHGIIGSLGAAKSSGVTLFVNTPNPGGGGILIQFRQ